jgi:hypothetical protein
MKLGTGLSVRFSGGQGAFLDFGYCHRDPDAPTNATIDERNGNIIGKHRKSPVSEYFTSFNKNN